MSENQTTGPVIRASGLTRHFTRSKQTIEAVRGLDLEVAPGELVAFLGPNGAGKTTTLRMLTTLIPPTTGRAEVAGFDVVRDRAAVRRSIGFVGQGNAAAHAQRGRDELVGQARAHGFTRREARTRADELLEAFELAEHADRPVSTLSGGQRRRLDVAIGLVNEPAVLFLDEPSTGLDPQHRANLAAQVRRLHRDLGTTIVLTTHYLEEADALAGRVIVIDHGRVIADDTVPSLKSALGDLVRFSVGSPEQAADAAARADRWPGAQITVEDTTVTIRAAGARDLAPGLVADLATSWVPVTGLEIVGPTLDDVFLDLTGRSLRDSAGSATDTHSEGEAA